MYNNVMNRGLFRRYARQPQAPQAPSGIMASSPELMQTAMRYQQGGMVQPPVAQPRVNPQFRPDLMRFADGTGPQGIQVDPTLRGSRSARRNQPSVNVTEQVDISQAPTEFKLATEEQISENPLAAYSNMGAAMGAKALEDQGKKAEVTEVDEAIATGEAVLSGEQQIDPSIIPPELSDAAAVIGNPESTDSETADAITNALGKGKGKGTKGKIQALKDTISEVFGVDASRYDSLKALNRAAVGFAIARGDDIADALAKGVQGAAAIEEKQIAREDAMSKMALEQAFAEKIAGMRNAAAMAGKASDYTPERLRQRAIESILKNPDQFDVYNPDTNAVDPVKVQEQANILVQSMIQSGGGVDITTPTATGNTTTTSTIPTTPGTRFRNRQTGKIMVVGDDGVAREE